jgi:hypothetical protein
MARTTVVSLTVRPGKLGPASPDAVVGARRYGKLAGVA